MFSKMLWAGLLLASAASVTATGDVEITPIAECGEFTRQIGFDVTPGVNRNVFFGTTAAICATICHQDVNCWSSVWNMALEQCFTKDSPPDAAVPGAEQLQVLECVEPRCVGDTCNPDEAIDAPVGICPQGDIRRREGADVTPGENLADFHEVFFEQDCLSLCLSVEGCGSSVHVSDAQLCFLKAEGFDSAEPASGRFTVLSCQGQDQD